MKCGVLFYSIGRMENFEKPLDNDVATNYTKNVATKIER